MTKRLILILVTLTATLNAEINIASKIQRLNTLPKTERFKLMNEIKRDLVRLNSTQRSEAIGKLRSAMRNRSGSKHMGIHNTQAQGAHLGNGCPNGQNIQSIQNTQNSVQITQEHKKNGGAKKHKNRPKNRPNKKNSSSKK